VVLSVGNWIRRLLRLSPSNVTYFTLVSSPLERHARMSNTVKASENNNLVPAQPKTEDEGTPENNKKMEVHDATEKTTDVSPKTVETEHKKEVLTGMIAKVARTKGIAGRNKKSNDLQGMGVGQSMPQMPKSPLPAGTGQGGIMGGGGPFSMSMAQKPTSMTYDPNNDNVKALQTQHPQDWQNVMAQSQGVEDPTQVKAAEGFDMNSLVDSLHKVKQPAMYGALGGAALGGLAGLIAPGHDAYGSPHGRFGSALRGALGGAAMGGLGGAAMGHFAPGTTQQAMSGISQAGNYLQQQGGDWYHKMMGQMGRQG
jgi:hypothetical protein